MIRYAGKPEYSEVYLMLCDTRTRSPDEPEHMKMYLMLCDAGNSIIVEVYLLLCFA